MCGHLSSQGAITRLAGAVLAQWRDEWPESRRSMGPGMLDACGKTALARKMGRMLPVT
jgi:hypothetical protein